MNKKVFDLPLTVTLTQKLPNSSYTRWKNVTLEWEVLTVHFEKQTMRVRAWWNGRKDVRNVDAAPFFDKYIIEDRNIYSVMTEQD